MLRKSFVYLLILVSFFANAQQDSIKKVKTMGSGSFTIGYGNLDVYKLRSFISDDGPAFNNNHLLIGGTGHGMINDFILGGSGVAILGDLIMTDNYKITTGGGVGTFDFGYQILDKEQLKLYPMIGFGGGGYGLHITRNTNIHVEDVLNQPGKEVDISVTSFVLDFSLNMNFIPAVMYDEKKSSYGGFMTGCKVGYLYSFPNSNWMYSGGNILGGPSFGLNMFYAKLIFGGFSYSKNSTK